MKVRNAEHREEIELQMTPMIDIVFLLLIFFIMTFKIVTLEGDFNIKMPLAAPSPGQPETPLPPLRVRMQSDGEGNLAGLALDNKTLENFEQLRGEVMRIVGGGPNALTDAEVELDVDYNLHYRYVIEAITAVTGYVKDGQVQKLVEKVKFAQPKEAPAESG